MREKRKRLCHNKLIHKTKGLGKSGHTSTLSRLTINNAVRDVNFPPLAVCPNIRHDSRLFSHTIQLQGMPHSDLGVAPLDPQPYQKYDPLFDTHIPAFSFVTSGQCIDIFSFCPGVSSENALSIEAWSCSLTVLRTDGLE